MNMENRIQINSLGLPEFALIVGSRALMGVGVGLLMADRISLNRRRKIGWSLLGLGIATALPLAADVLGRRLTITSGNRDTVVPH
jgi:hypothetical protein